MYHYILKINSRESDFKTYTNPIQISYNNLGNSSLIEKIVVRNASIPHVFYNINERNNKLTYTTLNGTSTITFPVGHYNINTLINYFNNTPEAIADNVSFSFDSFLNKILVSPVNTYITFNHINSSCFSILGLQLNQDYTILSNTPTHLQYMSDLSGIRNIYAETDFCNMNCVDSAGHKNYGAFIPVDAPFGSIIHYMNQEQELEGISRNKLYSQNMSKINISLKDVDGHLLDLQNMNWEITFKIYLSHEHDLVDN